MTVVAVVALAPRPPAWDVLALALAERRPVRARYRGAERVLCPHVLGWKSGRAKTLCYQSGGTTGHGGLPSNPAQRWRSLFVDDLEDVELLRSHRWGTAPNYSLLTDCVDQVEIFVAPDAVHGKAATAPGSAPPWAPPGLVTQSRRP